MSQEAIRKLWAFFGLTLLTLSFLFFLRTTGMDARGDSFGILGYKATTIPALALPMDFFLMSVFLLLSLVWSREVGGETWAHRQPLFYFDRSDVDPGTRGGQLYQGCTFFLTMVVPFATTCQMVARFFSGTVHVGCDCSNASAACKVACGQYEGTAVASGWGHFEYSRLSGIEAMLRFGATDGPQYFAFLPWFYGAWGTVLLLVWVFSVWSIVRGARGH